MDARTLEIYQILYQASGYVPQETLCSRLDIKPRTLRECFKDTREVLLREGGAEVIHKANHGYQLEISDPERFLSFLEENRIRLKEMEYSAPVTQAGRIDYMIRSFLSTRKYQRYEDIADRIYASRSTVYADLKAVREKLAEYHLELEQKQSEGLRIKGSEKNIRLCISDYFFRDNYAESLTFQNQPLGIFDERYAKRVSRIVDEVLAENQFSITDTGRQNLNIHILIALFRIQSDEYIAAHGMMQESLAGYEEIRRIAMAIRERIREAFDIEMPENETEYMMIHLLGNRIFSEEQDLNLIQPETMNITREILSAILNEYGIDFFSDIDLFTMLCLHLQPMIFRIKGGVRLHNPLLDDIREQSPMGYEMAAMTCSILNRHFHTDTAEDEIGYLALHFQLALEKRRKEQPKKKILAVCASGAGTSRLLMFRIQNQFADSIDKITSGGIADAQKAKPGEYDMIISTVPLKLKTDIPVFNVRYTLSDEDARMIRDFISGSSDEIRQALEVFDRDLFFAHCKFRKPKEIICFLCGALREAGAVPDGFEESVLAREKLSGTDIGHGTAMPHPLTLMAEKTKVAVCHLDRPVKWGKQNVTFVFLIAAENRQGSIYAVFSKALYALVSDPGAVAKLNEDPDYDLLISRIEKLCRSQKAQKPESIFQ